MRQKILINNGWQFIEEFEEPFLSNDYSSDLIKEVRIPHTCKEIPFHYFDENIYQMVCGYRKIIYGKQEWEGKKVFLTFEGSAHDTKVYLNGEQIGEHHCGYTAFTVDLTDKLHLGEDNLLAVCVNSREDVNIPPFGFVVDYMTYGGIYRDVYLEIQDPCFIKDVFVKPNHLDCLFKDDRSKRMAKRALLCSEIEVEGKIEDLFLCQTLKRWSEKKDNKEGILLCETALKKNKAVLEASVTDVHLWDIESPNLYVLTTELKKNGVVVDRKDVRFGFRKAEFKANGFYLNERNLKLFGLNRHQSYPYVGYAMPASMQIQDADILKYELGLNAVRTSHYPQSHYFLDRCDEIGLLVFTEIPGWQHIGDDAWKDVAVKNVEDMVLQYRNHTSIILWGVRINESKDDDAFYERTNAAAHRLDDTRPTGGVRAHKKSSLLEDVYTYNDFLHDGKAKGCDKKKDVTSDMSKAYLVSEYNGHMFPTKNFDSEEHRLEHAIRHATVLNAIRENEDIAGSFGWCMFDYNTHKDFGSGDRTCYHGVLDMFRNPKMAASVYASQQEKEPVLEISSSMDIGEHPGCNRGDTYVFTNADSVAMYKNDLFIKEFFGKDSKFENLIHGPILIDDFIGDQIEQNENFSKKQAKDLSYALNSYARFGFRKLPIKLIWIAAKMILFYHMKPNDAVQLYNRYIGDWGGSVTSYRFEAIKNGKVVKTVGKEPMKKVILSVKVDHMQLTEGDTYDVGAIRIIAKDENENVLHYLNEPVTFETEGPLQIIGPCVVALQGGMTGTFVKTTGETGTAKLHIKMNQAEEVIVPFQINDQIEQD